MAHFDTVLPGRVHRVIYERLIEDPEREVRRLLDYLGVPFEAECLQFYQNQRPVLTLSSEQVRMPLYSNATDHWRRYEPWLGTMKEILGCVLECYPETPKFFPRLQAELSIASSSAPTEEQLWPAFYQ